MSLIDKLDLKPELLDKVKSKTDNTIKYIFKINTGQIIELSYINKDDGKDIICVPTETSCNLGCKFCHITDIKNKLLCKGLEPFHIVESINYVFDDLNLESNKRTLLISFMGCGEPLNNVLNVYHTMLRLRDVYQDKKVPYIRFAIATSIPKNRWLDFFILTDFIKANKLPVKLHLSLHYTKDELRKEWMPSSLNIKESLLALEFYKLVTGNSVEIHYALIEGLNDANEDWNRLIDLLLEKDIPVKFLFFNEKGTLDYHSSEYKTYENFKFWLESEGIETEYYIPPGLDVGASCGQFLLDYYLKYNIKPNHE